MRAGRRHERGVEQLPGLGVVRAGLHGLDRKLSAHLVSVAPADFGLRGGGRP